METSMKKFREDNPSLDTINTHLSQGKCKVEKQQMYRKWSVLYSYEDVS
jgi:hypothetical protein